MQILPHVSVSCYFLFFHYSWICICNHVSELNGVIIMMRYKPVERIYIRRCWWRWWWYDDNDDNDDDDDEDDDDDDDDDDDNYDDDHDDDDMMMMMI